MLENDSSDDWLLCPDCGELLPSGAAICPECKLLFEHNLATCSECEAWIPDDVPICPVCHTVFTTTRTSLIKRKLSKKVHYKLFVKRDDTFADETHEATDIRGSFDGIQELVEEHALDFKERRPRPRPSMDDIDEDDDFLSGS
jgi:RNA polymerase subunit RPABC4/transcription elongation factor Spt4